MPNTDAKSMAEKASTVVSGKVWRMISATLRRLM
jgi:hypothetical protein